MATRRKATRGAGKRAVAYIRVSTDKQAESGLGLDDQRERLADYCRLHRFELVDLIADEGESAGKPLAKRTGGAKVLGLVKRKAVDVVIVLKLDRAFRNARDALEVADAWDAAGVGLHVVDMDGQGQSIDTQSAVGRMLFTVLAGVAEMERRLTAERTTAALSAKARAGNMRLGADAPFGWRYEGNGLAEIGEEQAVIKHVRELRGAGLSFRKTCKALELRGYRNRAGGAFVPRQLERMLQGSVRQQQAAE